MPCDEVEALRVGNFLYSTTRNFDLATEKSIEDLAKNICDFKEDPGALMVEDIICLDNKCQCLHPSKEWNPDSGKCRNRYGESCVDGDDCAFNQICSDMKGPAKIVRLSEYKWLYKRRCKEDCIRDTCEAKNKERCLHPGFKASLCKAVTDCLQDPFQVIFHCIAKCHKCEGSDRNAVTLQLCQHQCRTEVRNYAKVAINRVCHLTCRSDHDSKCVETCESKNYHLLKARLVDACPFSVPYEKCVGCVSDKVRFNSTALAILTDQCTKKCYLDGTTKDLKHCTKYCIEDCIAQKDRETFFECQARCKEESKTDPLCARICHNLALTKTEEIKYECADECGKAPSPCDLCVDNCRELKILGYQLGTVDNSSDPNCNEDCSKVSVYTCTACERFMQRRKGACYFRCKSAKTASDCSASCSSICKILQPEIKDSECYKKCLQNPDPLCFFNCIVNKNQETDEKCDKEQCTLAKIESSWNGECTACTGACDRIDTDLSGVYCDSSNPNVCKTQTPCAECHEIAFQNCLLEECKAGLKNYDDSVECHERCLDVCDRTRRFFYERSHTDILSCETYCQTGSRIGCTAGCESYCEATKTYRCNAVDCNVNPNDNTLIVLPDFDVNDDCISCRRRFRLRGRIECRQRLCAVPKAADEFGGICLQQCIVQAYRQLQLKYQSECIVKCISEGTPGRLCEDECIKTSVEQLEGNVIRYVAYLECVNTKTDIGFIDFCQEDRRCNRLCERAVEYESNMVCGIKDAKCVEGESSRKDQVILPLEPCRNCSIRVAIEYLTACRKTCSLPPDLIASPLTASQIERRSLICTAACQYVCYTNQFHIFYDDCLKKYVPGGSLPLTKYLKLCTGRYWREIFEVCTTTFCQADDFSTKELIHDCPKCTELCHWFDYFHLVAGFTCKDCKRQDVKPPNICEICKNAMIKETLCIDAICRLSSEDPNQCRLRCRYACGRLHCLLGGYRFNKYDEKGIRKCGIDIANEDNTTALGLSCKTNCEENCELTCNDYCIESYKLQGFCNMDCNPRLEGITTEVSNIQPNFRQSRKDPRGPVRPTRRPGPGKFGKQWCCFSNGFGQCNASRPNQESQQSQAIRMIDYTQIIWKSFLIIRLLSLAMIL